MKGLYYLFIFSLFAISGCGRNSKELADKAAESGNEIKSAKRFAIFRHKDSTEVRIINPWQGATEVTQIYHLVKRGTMLPAGIDSSSVIFVPVKKIISMSTTHLSMISALGEQQSVAGVSGTGFIYSEELMQRAKQGLISDVGYEANLNKELILKIHPDLIMIYGIGSESSGYLGKLKELGIRVIINADYLETDPVSRAEWIKLFGALYCKEDLADSLFNSEVNEYAKLKSFIVNNSSERPKVLLGLPFKDTWYISPGNSFISKMIGDAGGEYLWSDTKSAVSMPYGIENVYLRGLKADYWLNIGTVNSKNDISAIDPRLNDLPCFKTGNLYNNNNRVTSQGGNDYWEGGILYPHLILKDIAAILHPGLFPGYELMFYRKVN
jgi:iron complex transport system substrate-binding protein